MVVLCPVYATNNLTSSGYIGWEQFSVANLPDDPYNYAFWLHATYFCFLLYKEYAHFVGRRLEYLLQTLTETPLQANYSLMVENVPFNLQSETALYHFFDELFPGYVYAVELSQDTKDLDKFDF